MDRLFNTNPQSWNGPGFQESQGDFSTPPSSPPGSPNRRMSPPRAPTMRRTRNTENYPYNLSPMRLNLDQSSPQTHVPFTINDKQINNYIKRFYTTENNECTICYNELDNGQDICMIPQCGHIFHCECINQWVTPRPDERSSTRPTCPLCRTKTHKDDIINVILPPTPYPISSFGKRRNSELNYLKKFI